MSHTSPKKAFITTNELDTLPEFNGMALDLSTRISQSSPKKLKDVKRSMVEVISNVIKNNITQSKTEQPSLAKVTNLRLKYSTYGEVLTTNDVLERLTEAQ